MRTGMCAMAMVLVAAAPLCAAEGVKHVGTVVAVDAARQTITLEEAGPSRGPEIRLGKYTARIDPGARVELVERADRGSDGWPGGFVERELRAADVRPGDYASLSVEDRGGKPVVTRIQVIRPKS